MKSISKLFFFVACLSLAGCDNDENPVIESGDLSYFPLDVGNRWVYEAIRPENGSQSAVFTIVSTEVIDAQEYFAMESVYERQDGQTSRDTLYYRIDAQGFVFEVAGHGNPERNRFRLGADDGHTWNMESHYHPQQYRVTTSITDVTLDSGVLHECKSFSFDVPEWADEEHYFILAQGLGIVEFGNAWGFDYRLKSAKIGGGGL